MGERRKLVCNRSCIFILILVFIQFPYDAAFHTPDMLSFGFKVRGTRVIYIPYGFEISDTPIARKDHFNSRVVENSWRIYVSSEGIKEEYDKYCRNRDAVRVTGSPKFDSIKNKENFPLPIEITERAKGRPIIVWKMHFPKVNRINGKNCMITPYIREYVEFSKRVDAYDDYYFVVLPHPKMLGKLVSSDLQGEDQLIEESRELLSLLSLKENIYIDRSVDYRNSLFNASAIILDRSGVMIEAAMLDVPLLLMDNADYKEPFVTPVKDVMDTVKRGSTCSDICFFLDSLKDKTAQHNNDTKTMLKKWFPYDDGLCYKRIIEDIYNSMIGCYENMLPRVVLYGTGEIADYYMKSQNWIKPESFEIVAVVDSNNTRWGDSFYHYKIQSPNEIRKLVFDYVVVMTEVHFYEIQRCLVNDCFISDKRILRLDEFVFMMGLK